MHRRSVLLGAAGLGACSGCVPFMGKIKPTAIIDHATPELDRAFVSDVNRTDLPGTVIYDEVIPFDAGTFTPPSAANPSGVGGRIRGAVQSRVVRSTSTNTLIFGYRFRDLQFQPGSGPTNKGSSVVFIEIVTVDSFPASALPYEMYVLEKNQSLGGEPLSGSYAGNGVFEFNTQIIEPDGTTFFMILTTATKSTTGQHFDFDVDARGNGGTTTKVALDKIAIPA